MHAVNCKKIAIRAVLRSRLDFFLSAPVFGEEKKQLQLRLRPMSFLFKISLAIPGLSGQK